MRRAVRNVQVVPSRESSSQRGLARRTVILAVLAAAGAVLAAGLWPKSLPAGEEAQQIAALQAVCEEDQSWGRRALALREIAAVGGKDSVKALEALADSKDERVAAQALAAICRTACPGSDANLTSVNEAAWSSVAPAFFRAEHRAGRGWWRHPQHCLESTFAKTLVDDATLGPKPPPLLRTFTHRIGCVNLRGPCTRAIARGGREALPLRTAIVKSPEQGGETVFNG